MRLKFVKVLLAVALIGNVVIWYKIWRLFSVQRGAQTTPDSEDVAHENTHKFHRRFARLVTVIVRQFESFENDVVTTVDNILNSYPEINIIVVCDQLPYPPLELDFNNSTLRNVRLINLHPNFNKTFDERNPLFFVRTRFVLILPDATRFAPKAVLQEMLTKTTKFGAVAIPVGKNSLTCLSMRLKVREWSLKLSHSKGPDCDTIIGKHVTMMETKIMKRVSDPFLLPFTDALYIQTTALGIKINLSKGHHFNEGKPLYRSQQAQSKLTMVNRARERAMFERFGIKKVNRASGSVEWYGCTRETSCCFGSVINGVPAYLYQKRYTPPCCLAGLRKVAHHVMDKLEEVGIRFWLEGDSLLGAMRNSDILPWDHEVEIGLNRDDLSRSPWLVKARNKPVVDSHGFVWEKATEGEFFKVQYSKVNRLHVNLLPFYAKNGTMKRDEWFMKNRDFPEQFLHPMSSIEFAGRQVPSPNNISDFLEIKYYKGVIENPEFPGKISFD